MKRKIIPYNPKLKEYARKLRRNMTLAEVLLWNHLKQKKMLGYDFDRQRPIDEYIVDFFCKDLCLAIEVDGRSHDYKKGKDEMRQKCLESLGVRFLRFWEYEVKSNMGSVVRRIEEWIREHTIENPPLTPPGRGTRTHGHARRYQPACPERPGLLNPHS